MKKITKQELIERLALHDRLGTNAAAKEVLETLLETIATEVTAGNEVYLGQSFGGFAPAKQAGRSGTMNGVDYDSPEKQVIKFKPSSGLKDQVAGA